MLRVASTRTPMIGLLTQSALARLSDQMAAVVYGWGLLEETGNSQASSLVIAASLGALVIGTLFAGRLIALFGARRVALAGVWTSVAAAFAIALLFLDGFSNPVVVAAIVALGAILDGPAGIATETNYPEIARIARFDLVRLNAIDDGLDHAAGLVAPAAGAALVALHGVTAGALVLALLGLSAAVTLTLALPRFRSSQAVAGASLAGALRLIRLDNLLFPLTVMFSLAMGIFIALELIVLPRMIAETGMGAGMLALFLSSAGIGGLAGAATAAPLSRRIPLPSLVAIVFGLMASGVAIAIFAVNAMALTACGALLGFASGIVTPVAVSLFQTRPPKNLRADVQAVSGALIFATTPIALVAGGMAADLVEPYIVMAAFLLVLTMLAALAWFWVPDAGCTGKKETPRPSRDATP